MAEKKVTPIGNGMAKVEIEVTDNKKVVPHWYIIPATPEDFLKWVSNLPAEGENKSEEQQKGTLSLEEVYDHFRYSLDLKQRASVREAVAAESTVISRDGKEIDLFTLEPRAMAAVINGAAMQVTLLGGKLQKAFEVTRKKALEAGVLVEGEGGTVKPK
jgi:hypothetical protein